MPGNIYYFTKRDEFKELLKTSKLIVVDFTASWCGPCKNAKPYINTFFDNNKDRLNYDGSVINGHGTWEKFLESFENEDEWLIAWAKIRNLEHQFIDVNLVNDYNKVVELIPANKNVLLQCSNIFLYESNYFNRGPLTAVNSIDYVKQVRNISNKVIFNGDINGSYYDMINTNRLKWI